MLSVETAREIAEQWRPRFIDESSFETSWNRFYEMTGDPTAEKLHTWLGKDQAKDAVRHAGIVREPVLPVQQDYDLSAKQVRDYIASGDLHNWEGIEEPEYNHVSRCPRCQMGIESRRIVDERARATGKLPFPSIAF